MTKLYKTTEGKLLWRDNKLMTECCCNEGCTFDEWDIGHNLHIKALLQVEWEGNINLGSNGIMFGGQSFYYSGQKICINLAQTIYDDCVGDYPTPAGETLVGDPYPSFIDSTTFTLAARNGGVVWCDEFMPEEDFCYEESLMGGCSNYYFSVNQTKNFGIDACTGKTGDAMQPDGFDIYTRYDIEVLSVSGNFVFTGSRVPNTQFAVVVDYKDRVYGTVVTYRLLGLYRWEG